MFFPLAAVWRGLLSAFLATLLAACGGGGSGAPSAPPPAVGAAPDSAPLASGTGGLGGTATTSLSNVRISLADLAPNDGVDPSYTFVDAYTRAFGFFGDESLILAGFMAPFARTTDAQSKFSVSAEVSSTALTVSVANTGFCGSGLYQQIITGASGHLQGAPDFGHPSENLHLVLSPRTQMFFNADLTHSVTALASSVPGGFSNVDVQLNFTEFFEATPRLVDLYISPTRYVSRLNLAEGEDHPTTNARVDSIALSISNDTDESRVVEIFLSIDAGAATALCPPPGCEPPPPPGGVD